MMIGKDNKDIATLTIAELRDEIINLTRSLPAPNNLTLVALKAALDARIAEAQVTAAAQQAAAAQQMVAPTQALANFTSALVNATRALVFIGAATMLLTIVQILVALGIIHR
jgi:hypothetical protein